MFGLANNVQLYHHLKPQHPHSILISLPPLFLQYLYRFLQNDACFPQEDGAFLYPPQQDPPADCFSHLDHYSHHPLGRATHPAQSAPGSLNHYGSRHGKLIFRHTISQI